MAITYKGFSTYKKQFSNSFTLSGFELAKQDLVNHFNIRKGEKLMNPEFGSIVWDALYEPLTYEIVSEIEEDVKSIVGYDPRLVAESILLEQYALRVGLQLQLVGLAVGEPVKAHVEPVVAREVGVGWVMADTVKDSLQRVILS